MSFIIKNKNIEFKVISENYIKQKDGEITVEVINDAPTPVILPGDRLILPVGEGIAINVDEYYESGEFSCENIGCNFCNGHNAAMSMILLERNNSFLAICPNDPVNAGYVVKKVDGIYNLFLSCNKKSTVSYNVFGFLPEACKWYRNKYNPDCRTLSDKIKRNKNIENLIGGAIFWVWNDNYNDVMYSDHDVSISPASGEKLLEIAEDLHNNGVSKALFGLFFEEDSHLSEPLYKKYGFLSTQYDNYNDVLDPKLLDIIPKNRVKNCDYTARRMKDYPDGVMITKEGELAPAWALKGFDGKMHTQNTMCPACAKIRMQEEIPEILKKYPYYSGRFIDVFGGSVSECFSKDHPLTKEESITVKNEAFEFLENMGLIVGTEEGFDKIIDHIAYSEGFHSPVYYRNNNSGRNHANIYTNEQCDHIKKNMLNPKRRIPLWQLTYHDCLLTFPYWGDSTAMSLDIIRDKTLFACLYGCPPLYSFKEENYKKLKQAILKSYKTITAVHEKTALLTMTDFKILSDDYMLQCSVFGDKYRITANFSNEPREVDGKTVLPKDFILEEI